MGFTSDIMPKADRWLRFCVKSQLLKPVIARDLYTIARMDDYIDSLGDINPFKTFYCNSGYRLILDVERAAHVCFASLCQHM